MAVQTAVDVLARMLDAYDSADRSVHHVGATSIEDGGDALHVDLEVTAPVGAGDDTTAPPVDADLTEDGRLAVEYPTSGVPSVPAPPDATVEAVPTSARVDGDRILLSMEVTITPDDEAGRDRESNDDPDRADDGPDPADGGPRSADTALDDGRAAAGTETNGRAGATSEDGDARNDAGPDATGRRSGSSDEADDGAARRDAARTDATPTDDTGTGADPATDPEPTAGENDACEELAALRNESVPPYDDTAYLRAIYDRYDTFAEMRTAIEMDVSTETVRRYMIDADVHDPRTYGTTGPESGPAGGDGGDVSVDESGAGVDEPPGPGGSVPDDQLVTDGIGLPDDLSLETVLEAVVESATVYEVTRTLEMDQRRTRALLEQLDLLELVMTRVSDDHKRDVTYEDVADRLRRTTRSAG